MEDNKKLVKEKLRYFVKFGLLLYGNEIELPSIAYFGFNEILKFDNQTDGLHRYTIQYGYPQSGCVTLTLDYNPGEKTIDIKKYSVYANEEDNDLVGATFNTKLKTEIGPADVSFGIDLGTKEYSDISDIAKSPNAIKMLDTAISDLSKANVIGPCNVMVPDESDSVPVAYSRENFPKL